MWAITNISNIIFINSRGITSVLNDYDDVFMMLRELTIVHYNHVYRLNAWAYITESAIFISDGTPTQYDIIDHIKLEGKISSWIILCYKYTPLFTFLHINGCTHFRNKKCRILTREVLRVLLMQCEFALFRVITFIWLSSNRRFAWVWNNGRIILIAND